MRKALNIGVVGAGPAGLAAALFLARSGHRVEIMERFDRPAPVGSGLLMQPTGLSVLSDLGLFDTIRPRGSRIDRLHGADAASGRTVLDVRYDAVRGGRYGLAVQRAALFDTLHDAVVRAGIPVRTGVGLAGARMVGDRMVLRASDGQDVGAYDLVIDASGARSALAATSAVAPVVRDLAYGAFWATLDGRDMDHDPHALSQRYDKAKVMIGVLPVGTAKIGMPDGVAFFWSLKVADAENVKSAGLGRWKAQVLSYWPDCAPLLEQIVDWEQMTLARYAHRTTLPPHTDRLVFIGDSAHSTSPQLGQGANMALLDAATLCFAVDNAEDVFSALSAYARMRRNHVRLFQALSLVFTPFYQSDSAAVAWIRDRMVSTIARIPPVPAVLASIVAGTLVDPFAQAGIVERDWLADEHTAF